MHPNLLRAMPLPVQSILEQQGDHGSTPAALRALFLQVRSRVSIKGVITRTTPAAEALCI